MRLVPLILLFALRWGVPGAAAQQIYLEYPHGLPVPLCALPVQDPPFEDHTLIRDFVSESYRGVDPVRGTATTAPILAPVTFDMAIDCTAPVWIQMASENRTIDELVFKFTQSGSPFAGEEFFEIELRDVHVISVEQTWDSDSVLLPSNRVSLTFGRITWTYLDGGYSYAFDRTLQARLSPLFVDVATAGSDVHLSWGVAADGTATGYEVLHRAGPGSGYRTVVHLDAVREARVIRYEATVSNLEDGPHWFLLKEIRFDGTDVYSDEIDVEVHSRPVTHRLTGPYPNPVATSAELAIIVDESQRVTVALHDLLGRKVTTAFSGLLQGGRNHLIPLSIPAELADGIYVLAVEGERFVTSTTVLRLR